MFRTLLLQPHPAVQFKHSNEMFKHSHNIFMSVARTRPINHTVSSVEVSTKLCQQQRSFQKSTSLIAGIAWNFCRSAQLLQRKSILSDSGSSCCRYLYCRNEQNSKIPSIVVPQHQLRQRATRTVLMYNNYHTSTRQLFGLEEFRDSVSRQQRDMQPVGRSWSAVELRRKSYDDLHKLWYVLYKERNMLMTEQQLSRRKQLIFPQSDRIHKVRRSMGAIKHVLGERKREHLFRIKAAHEEGKEAQAGTTIDDDSIAQQQKSVETKQSKKQ